MDSLNVTDKKTALKSPWAANNVSKWTGTVSVLTGGSIPQRLVLGPWPLGTGGHQPTMATFGADQFDETNPKDKSSKAAFFCYFYFAFNVGSLFSNTILVYYEDTGKWTLGFWVSTGAAVIALVSFLLGSRGYRYIKPCGNPLPRVTQVFVAAARKWKVVPADEKELYEVEGSESAIKESRKILHSNEFECLDKAATLTEFSKAKSTPGGFALSLNVLVFTGIYRQILVPLASRLSGNPKGLTELQRMGIGLVIGLLAIVAAGVTELARLKRVIPETHSSSLSIFWQIPQYVFVGASEVFMYVGQLEFFNGQAPDGIKSFGSSLCMASISLGNYVSSMLVHMIMGITARGNSSGWIPEDLNDGHMDRFYFLIAALTAADFVVYVYCAMWYKCINVVDSKIELLKDGQMEEEAIHRV
ncbi:major facilitator superfamily protein [Actinidia rufa]|uniref:Major facilitator superfamily protein n=1 Tax=Actinidia rufa TaxID=165716 RepID=A0A7J0GQC2_9ERIC|nr:major facilitator superfamily protein [Actinidia rufa]